MISTEFEYKRASSLDEAISLIQQSNGEGKLLAGGHSLIPLMKLRLSEPGVLIDISRIDQLQGIRERDGGKLEIGAGTTHHAVATNDLLRSRCPIVSDAAAEIGDQQVRNRGTLGGSLALADPAAELPACAVALDAVLIIASRKGERRVRAVEFFKGLFETDLKQGEILVGAEFPKAEKSAFVELTRRHGDYAIVGLAAVTKQRERRISLFGFADRPVLIRPGSLEEAKGSLPKPAADLYHSSATKLHLAKVLLERAWNRL